MIVGCYSLDLYCDNPACKGGPLKGQNRAEFTGETAGTCRRQARYIGWELNLETGACVCPRCAPTIKPTVPI